MRLARSLFRARQAASRCRCASRTVTAAKKTGAESTTPITTTTSALRISSSSSSNRRRRSLSSAALPPPTADSQPWPELGDLRELYNSVGNPTRVRQHANPLTAELQVPIEPPSSWQEWYDDPGRPLVVDVGCGSGRFGLALLRAADSAAAASAAAAAAAASAAAADSTDSTNPPSPILPGFDPPYNLLGIEIRAKLVERANAWASRLSLSGRARFVSGNATVSLPAGLLRGYPGEIALACVQYPDPHFKERHRKRRVVQAPFARALAEALAPKGDGGSGSGSGGSGSENNVGRVFLQSDVLEVASSMRSAFEAAASDLLEPCHALHGAPSVSGSSSVSSSSSSSSSSSWKDADGGWGAAGWLPENPLRVPTEREVHTLSQGLPVYRFVLEKKT